MIDIISHERYNRIGFVESQSAALTEASFRSAWPEIYEVMAQHRSLGSFGISLLHRHHDLPADHVFVHDWDEHGHDLCQAELLGSRTVHPTAYQLQDGRVTAYEFSSRPTSIPKPALLVDMAVCLQSHQLEQLLALSSIEEPETLWLEETLINTDGTRAVRCAQKGHIQWQQYIATEWRFTNSGNGPTLKVLRGCAKQDNGGHLRTG